MKSVLIVFAFLLIGVTLFAQNSNEEYNTYIAVYEDGFPGSTIFREDLIEIAPVSGYEFVLVTGLKYKPSREDGFPENASLNLLQEAGDKLADALNKQVKNIFAGSFTSNGERLEYFYIKTPEDIKNFVDNFYKENYPKEEYLS